MARPALIEIDLSGVKQLEAHYRSFTQAIDTAFPIAVNEAARFALKTSSDAMYKQVAFPPNYLKEPERFEISRFATQSDTTAKIDARGRGTSLYRFAKGNPTPQSTMGWEDEGKVAIKLGLNLSSGVRRRLRAEAASRNEATRLKVGVQVQIKPGGRVVDMPTAFVIGFANSYQVAVRLKGNRLPPGFQKKLMRIDEKYATKKDKDLYVLYGPSVDQVFNEVRADIEPDVVSFAFEEFRRQFFVRLRK
jgi:hypothetical protein